MFINVRLILPWECIVFFEWAYPDVPERCLCVGPRYYARESLCVRVQLFMLPLNVFVCQCVCVRACICVRVDVCVCFGV